MKHIQNYIDGELINPSSNEWLDNINPATAELINRVPISNARDISAAADAAHRAFSYWSQLSVDDRAQALLSLADYIEHNAEAFALAESIDTGKPIALAQRVDIPRSIKNLRFFANAGTQFGGESYHQPGSLNYTNYRAMGAVACISPWNLPLYLLTWKIAPALAVGNTVVAKPSELSPTTAFMLAEACKRTNMPPGVLNLVHGPGKPTGELLVSHPKIKAISFTGGTATGRSIATVAASSLTKTSLELGGKNPALVFADCDFENTLDTLVKSSFTNQGEICLCSSRILVEKPIYEKFRDAFVKKTKALKSGDPLEPSTDQGALVSRQHYDKVLKAIATAKEEGARVLCGGQSIQIEGRCERGYFVEPTVLEGLDHSCRTMQQEIFGPVVALAPFDCEDEAVELANHSVYGLSATIFTNNLTRAHRISAQVEAGVVWVNTWLNRDLRTPFGGMKASGIGREGGLSALRFFTEAQNVCIAIDSP